MPEPPTGTISVALSQDQCARYCLTALRATLYPEGEPLLPLGPALQIDCGEEVSFSALPAGERLVVSLSAFDVTGEVLLSGASVPVTVAADGVTEVAVPLSALSAPEIDLASPEPVVVASGPVEVVLSGRFGDPTGQIGVALGAHEFAAGARWSPQGDTITVTVPADASGDAFQVRRCGIASAPYAVRVIGATAGEAAVVGGPTCAGGAAHAAAIFQDDVLVAWGCDDTSQGMLARMAPDEALCPLDPGASWALGATPTALAVLGEAAWVGTASGLLRVDLGAAGAAAPTTLALGERVAALAGTVARVYALLTTADGARVARIDDTGAYAVSGLDAALVPTALGAAGGRAFVAAQTGGGRGRLVAIPDAGVVTTWSLEGEAGVCERPTALAVATDGQRVAVACAGSRLALWQVDGERLWFLDAPHAVEALAFDDPGDVLFAADAAVSALAILDADDGLLHVVSRPGAQASRSRLLTPVGAHRLLVPSGLPPLAVLTPFDPAGPCGGAP